jgi:hypothetical protein
VTVGPLDFPRLFASQEAGSLRMTPLRESIIQAEPLPGLLAIPRFDTIAL